MGRADGGRAGRKKEAMLALLATGAPASRSPSIAGHRCKNTVPKPPTLSDAPAWSAVVGNFHCMCKYGQNLGIAPERPLPKD